MAPLCDPKSQTGQRGTATYHHNSSLVLFAGDTKSPVTSHSFLHGCPDREDCTSNCRIKQDLPSSHVFGQVFDDSNTEPIQSCTPQGLSDHSPLKQSYLPWLIVLEWLNFISKILGILNSARPLQFRPNELSPNFRQREESYLLNMDCLFIDTYGQQLEEILVMSNPLPTVRKEVIPNQLQSFTWSMSHSEHILGHIYHE